MLGVAIGYPDLKHDQRHVGLVFKNGLNQTKFLHLRWHSDLCCEPMPTRYIWMESPLDPITKIHMATYCQTIFEQNSLDGIPYSIFFDDEPFTETGKYNREKKSSGLTCSTFIMAVFQRQGLDIIDLDRWKHKQDDKVWQKQIIQLLRSTKHTEQAKLLAKRFRKYKKTIARFRPEAVAAAAALPNPPYVAEKITEESKLLVKEAKSNALRINGTV